MMVFQIELLQQEELVCWDHKIKAVRMHQELIYHKAPSLEIITQKRL